MTTATERKPLTFAAWKKAFKADGLFRTNPPYMQAVSIVFNAYISRRDGELTDRGLKAALNWAYDLDHGAALHEDLRAEARNYYRRTADAGTTPA